MKPDSHRNIEVMVMEILVSFVLGGLVGFMAQCLLAAFHSRSGRGDKQDKK